MYDPKIMHDQYEECSDEELHSVLITCDGRGPINKQKALDILLKREYNKGHNDLRIAIGEQP